jgi:uncharacterized protein YxeA
MNQFRIVIRFAFVNVLLRRKYTDMKIMFEIAREVEDQKNDLNSRYPRFENKSQREFVRNQTSQSSQENQNKQTVKFDDQGQSKQSKDVKLSTSEHSNNRFESVSIKSIG